jgi:hypothetical protein
MRKYVKGLYVLMCVFCVCRLWGPYRGKTLAYYFTIMWGHFKVEHFGGCDIMQQFYVLVTLRFCSSIKHTVLTDPYFLPNVTTLNSGGIQTVHH